jgi:uncharacterized protein (TIGR03067 family)
MAARLLVILVALAGATAFAPAPFPRPGRPSGAAGLDARSLQGTWKVEKVERTVAGGYRPNASATSRIRIEEGLWTFVRDPSNGRPGRATSYRLVVHAGRAPVALDGMRPTDPKPYMLGIVRQRGDAIEVLYRFRGTRPDDFDNPPAGCWRITMRRQK